MEWECKRCKLQGSWIIFGVSDKAVRLCRRDFLCNDGGLSEDSRGKYVRYQVIFDEDYCDRALD